MSLLNGKLTEDGEYWVNDADDCHYQSKNDYIQIVLLGNCGCGESDKIAEYVRDNLRQIVAKTFNHKIIHNYFFLVWADDKDFLEHGSSIYGSWLTEKGFELLKILETEYDYN